MKLNKLKVAQDGLRDTTQLPAMIDLIKKGGRFNQQSLKKYHQENPDTYESSIVEIVELPDGEYYIGDGHHRIVAIYLSGRDFLYEDEYHIIKYSYEDYYDINFNVKWMTPIRIKEEIRLPDFFEFKKEVYKRLEVSEQFARDFIWGNRDKFCKPRNITTVKELVERI